MRLSKGNNHLGGTDVTDNTYNFAGELTASTRAHTANSATTTIASRYEYDHMGRKKATFASINGQPEIVLSKLDYNEVGQLLKKDLHSTDNGANFMQSMDYAYNERGWMRKINDALTVTANRVFGMELAYGNKADAFNGNIGGASWQTKVPPGLGLFQQVQGNVYNYDKLNRLTSAVYNSSGSANKFNEELAYDLMGNITNLKRKNAVSGYLNNFTYNYTSGGVAGNRLMGVSDAGTAAQGSNYTYNANGSQITDSRKGLGIVYNELNLPSTISKASTGESIAYTFDATGNKLKKVSGLTVRDYAGGIEYNNGAIDFIQTEEGRALPGSPYTYEYMLKDHLGNTRATVKQNGDIVQVQDYYAFGMEMNPGNMVAANPDNRYTYNGKETQKELGLDQLDYGARFYDPVIGRWNVVDNKAEAYESVSPYVYAVNDPVNAIDPDGNLVIFVNGFVPGQWLNQNNRKYSSNGSSNPYYRPYPPSRALTNNYPQNLGKSFDYWGDIDNAFMQGYTDNHSMYINGSSDNTSDASDRFSEGVTSANNLISQLDGGKISLADGETIKIVGHSQGGAFAAGMASVLSKNKKYASVIQEVVYLEPHQPADFNHPSSINGIQISSPDDLVASKNIYPLFKGETSYSRINGIRRFITNDTHKGDSLRGHSVGTNLDEIASYFRSLGVKVTVTE
jgi:RHS repeat-associated protein